jgi:hypothetical protein
MRSRMMSSSLIPEVPAKDRRARRSPRPIPTPLVNLTERLIACAVELVVRL